MTKSEMTKLETRWNTEARKTGNWRKILADLCFVIDSSFGFRHSSFCL